MNLPNILTGTRILLIPVLVIVFYLPFDGHYLVSAGLFTLASVTDWLDGYLARRLGQTTQFGAFLDPVADKLLVAVALVLLVADHASVFLTIPALVIVGREIVVSALREWMAHYSHLRGVTVSVLAKAKTLFQMIAIILLIASGPGFSWPMLLGQTLLYISAGLTLWSMYQYLKLAWPDLSSRMTSE